MCPLPTQQAPSKHRSQLASNGPYQRPQCTPRKPPRLQQMLWNFIQTHLQNPIPQQAPPLTQASELILNLEQTPSDIPAAPQTPPSQPPTIIPEPKENQAWGDYQKVNQPHGLFRVVSKNLSTINTYLLNMMAIATELQTMDTSIFFAQETN